MTQPLYYLALSPLCNISLNPQRPFLDFKAKPPASKNKSLSFINVMYRKFKFFKYLTFLKSFIMIRIMKSLQVILNTTHALIELAYNFIGAYGSILR